MYMSIQIVTENTLQNVMHNRNLQKFCMFLLNAYPILGSCTVLCSVTEDTRPAYALSRSDVKIFTLFVNWCKHFVIAMPLPAPSHCTQRATAHPVLLAFLVGKA